MMNISVIKTNVKRLSDTFFDKPYRVGFVLSMIFIIFIIIGFFINLPYLWLDYNDGIKTTATITEFIDNSMHIEYCVEVSPGADFMCSRSVECYDFLLRLNNSVQVIYDVNNPDDFAYSSIIAWLLIFFGFIGFLITITYAMIKRHKLSKVIK